MTVNELYAKLDELIPASLLCEWDNDGLMCCPNAQREVRRVLVCLDVTADAVNKAIDEGFDAIVSHHPFIFKGLKAVTEESFIPKKAIELIRADLSVMSFHTRLDAVCGGVNDKLASILGLENVEPFGDGIGRIGELCEVTDAQSFAKKVKEALGAPAVSLADSKREIKRVAVLGGSGDDFISEAIMRSADAYVSGELGYHPMTDAPDMGITLIEAGHFYTEMPVCEVLCDMIKKIDGSVACEIYDSNRTVVI